MLRNLSTMIRRRQKVPRSGASELRRSGALEPADDVSELAGDASEPVDDDTTSAEGPAEWCQLEIVSVDVALM